jgi:hypothetical protein
MRHELGCALVLALTFAASTASASMCPVLVKQGRDAAATMNQNDAKVKNAVPKLDETQKLHDGGKHADSLKLANEAAASLK